MRQRRPRPSQQQPPLRDIPKRLRRSLLPSSIKQDSLIYTAVFLCRHATLVLLDNIKNGYVAHYDEERGTDLKWQEKRRQIGRRASLKEMSLKRHEMTWINNVISYAFHLVKTMLLLISVPVKSCCIIAVGGFFASSVSADAFVSQG